MLDQKSRLLCKGIGTYLISPLWVTKPLKRESASSLVYAAFKNTQIALMTG